MLSKISAVIISQVSKDNNIEYFYIFLNVMYCNRMDIRVQKKKKDLYNFALFLKLKNIRLR